MSHFVDPDERYFADELIATGGMGEVWRGWDTSLDRPIAIKVLRREYAGDSIFRARFEAEARHAASLSAAGVAAVWDVGAMAEVDGVARPFLVMELVDGQPLSALIRRGVGMDPEVVREIIGQTANALAVAHRAGIVHRDVKPANLLITRDRQVKITDFGIARALSAMSLTGTGSVMGTPQYISPEQARGDTASPASDVYGLGVVAYECLTGLRPFDKETPVATAMAHLHDAVPPLPDSVPADLASVVMKALAKKPGHRYPDGAAFAAALALADGNGPVFATPVSTVSAPPAAAATGSIPPAPAPMTPETLVLSALAHSEVERNFAGAPATTVTAPINLPTAVEDDSHSKRAVAITVAAALGLGIIGWLVFRPDHHGVDPTADLSTPAVTVSTSPSVSDTPSPTASPTAFDLDPATYIGADVDTVMADLSSLGLHPTKRQVPNSGTDTPNTVASIDPSTDLTKGDEVTVAYYGPVPEKTTKPEPTPSEPTDESSSADPEPPLPSLTIPTSQTSAPAARKETR